MDYGVLLSTPHEEFDLPAVAQWVEERGFDSIFLPEHTHFPIEKPAGDGARPPSPEMPPGYEHTYDPFVAAAFIAATTTTLKIATGVCLVVQRDPITTAKEVATLDHLSRGRMMFGVGAGWNRQEMLNHGTDPRTRMKLLSDRINAMKAIWSQDEAEYHGAYVDFGPLLSQPKPFNRASPPILIGGDGPTVLDRVIELGDEWMPQAVHPDAFADFAGRIAQLQVRAKDVGRQPVPVTTVGVSGTRADVVKYQQAGVTRCVFILPPGDADATRLLLDQFAQVMA
jgi:probable F420-dependent oxidoreductase